MTTSESQTANPLGQAAYEFRKDVLAAAKRGDNEIDAFLAHSAVSSSKGLSEYQIDYLQHKYMNFCDKCNCVKPPRTHHCSQVGRCVIRMDHHCRWVANVVG